MERYSLSHLADPSLLRGLHELVTRDRATTADMLAHIAETDHRRLYARAGYPSMRAYCVGELRLSEDSAAKRIQAARKAREFPVIFDAVADGRLHLTAVNLLAPYLHEETVDELVAAATHQSKADIELLLAERFPRCDAAEWVEATEHAPGHVGDEHAPAHAGDEHAPGHAGNRSKLTPFAPGRFLIQCTIGKETREKLQYAMELLSHQNPSGRLSAVIDRALDTLIPELEKQKFAATDAPRPGRPTTSERHIPAQVKQAVWKRDGGACTFIGETGHACGSRWMVEFDHIHEVARGGEATIENVRLRCRLCRYRHNRHYAASGFMPRWRGVVLPGQPGVALPG